MPSKGKEIHLFSWEKKFLMLFFALYIPTAYLVVKYKSILRKMLYTKFLVPFYVPTYIFIVLIFQGLLQLPHMYF